MPPDAAAPAGFVAAKEVSVKKYVVRLSAKERARLDDLVHAGRRPAQLLTKARILLKADVSDAGDGWSDSRIAEALDTSIANICLLYTSDAADEEDSVDLGGRRII